MIQKLYIISFTVSSLFLALTTVPVSATPLLTCCDCHKEMQALQPPKNHPVVGTKGDEQYNRIETLIKETSTLQFLAAQHMNQGVSCAQCHVEDFQIGTEVDTQMCLSCHESYEHLASLTEHPTVKTQNPHRSHLGEMDCIVCHRGHIASRSYCLECHTNFEMPIPAGGS